MIITRYIVLLHFTLSFSATYGQQANAKQYLKTKLSVGISLQTSNFFDKNVKSKGLFLKKYPTANSSYQYSLRPSFGANLMYSFKKDAMRAVFIDFQENYYYSQNLSFGDALNRSYRTINFDYLKLLKNVNRMSLYALIGVNYRKGGEVVYIGRYYWEVINETIVLNNIGASLGGRIQWNFIKSLSTNLELIYYRYLIGKDSYAKAFGRFIKPSFQNVSLATGLTYHF